jgi:hypothetical protein
MSKNSSRTTSLVATVGKLNLSKFVTAGALYTGFAIYLYQPYFNRFSSCAPERYLLVFNACLASLGCFVLTRRWVAAFWGSFFAGTIYGFGPFALGLAKFHPVASLLIATVPWLFCPAAFGLKAKWRWIRWPLSALPFLAIFLFFQALTHWRLFAIPIQAKLHLADVGRLVVPLVAAEQGTTLVGFYHIAIAPLIMGFSMLIAARRFGVMVIFGLGAILAFCNSFFEISPIIWLTIPMLCCSVLIGAGMEGLAWAGSADRRWVLMTAVIMTVLSVVTLLLATKYFQIFAGLGGRYAKLLVKTAEMYILSTVAVAIVFFTARAKLRIHWLRWAILCSAMAVDIFLGARFVVGKVL